MKPFLRSPLVSTGAIVLIAQMLWTHATVRAEARLTTTPLTSTPFQIDSWQGGFDDPIDPDILDQLTADEVLNRNYRSGDNVVNLFVAYYSSQLGGKRTHSPKVCLPGSGWVVSNTRKTSCPIGGGVSVPINEMLVQKEPAQSIVLYWYQTPRRVVTQENVLNFYRVWDYVRDARTDAALVRVIAPVYQDDVKKARTQALDFAALVYPYIARKFASAH